MICQTSSQLLMALDWRARNCCRCDWRKSYLRFLGATSATLAALSRKLCRNKYWMAEGAYLKTKG